MSEKSEWKVDRTNWDPGPWDSEPDKANWTTATGLPGMIVRNRMGGLCGYVGVPNGHPLYGIEYGAAVNGRPLDFMINVHGGLTYSDRCNGHICHVPAPGEPDDVWWFGFDCVHSGDGYPAETAHRKLPGWPKSCDDVRLSGAYRDMRYVRREVESLAEQLVAAGTDAQPATGGEGTEKR